MAMAEARGDGMNQLDKELSANVEAEQDIFDKSLTHYRWMTNILNRQNNEFSTFIALVKEASFIVQQRVMLNYGEKQ